jgi:hypothetical protein
LSTAVTHFALPVTGLRGRVKCVKTTMRSERGKTSLKLT